MKVKDNQQRIIISWSAVLKHPLKKGAMSRLITLSLVALAAVLCTAAQPRPANGNSEVGLRVSPTHITPVIAVGDTAREAITLQNSSNGEVVVSGRIGEGPNNDGKAEIHLEPEQLSLKPGQTSSVTLVIDVPAAAEAGQTQNVLLFDIMSTSGRDVSIVGQIAVVLDIKTIHPVDEVEISMPLIIDSSDSASVTLKGRNAGNFPTMLRGAVAIERLLGEDILLNSDSEKIQAGESAVSFAFWDGVPYLGAGRMTATLGAGVGAPVEKSSWFVVFPWKLGLMVIFIVLTAAAGALYAPFFAKVFRLNWRKEGKIGR